MVFTAIHGVACGTGVCGEQVLTTLDRYPLEFFLFLFAELGHSRVRLDGDNEMIGGLLFNQVFGGGFVA